ncbi:hypothetical protein ACI8AF_05945 [Blastococcus sp. SYSU D00669]
MRWTEHLTPVEAVRPGRWTAGLVAAAGLGVALVGGLTAATPAGTERDVPAPPGMATDAPAEPTGRGGLPVAVPTPSPTTSPAPAAPPAPVGAPQTGAQQPAAVAVADVVPVGEPGRPCATEGAAAVTAAGRALVCTARGSGQLRWRQV